MFMSLKLMCILIGLIPNLLFAQSPTDSRAADNTIIYEECEGPQFTKTEILPSFKIPKEAFEDSIYSYLKAKDILIKNQKITLSLLLTTKLQVLDAGGKTHELKHQKDILEAIFHYAHLWVPAIQNNRKVCSIVYLKIEFTEDNLNVIVSQSGS